MTDIPPAAEASSPPSSRSPWKWIAIVCGGCLGVSVLVLAVTAIFISRFVSLSVDSGEVEANAQDLFTYTMPGESRGVLNMDIFGVEIVQIATPESPPAVMLTMGNLPAYLQAEEFRQTFIDSLRENVAVESNYQFIEQRTETASLCGQSVPVVVQEGRYENNQTTDEPA